MTTDSSVSAPDAEACAAVYAIAEKRPSRGLIRTLHRSHLGSEESAWRHHASFGQGGEYIAVAFFLAKRIRRIGKRHAESYA